MTSEMSDQAQRANLASSWGSLRRHNVWSITLSPDADRHAVVYQTILGKYGTPVIDRFAFVGESRSQYGALDPQTFSFRLTNGGRR